MSCHIAIIVLLAVVVDVSILSEEITFFSHVVKMNIIFLNRAGWPVKKDHFAQANKLKKTHCSLSLINQEDQDPVQCKLSQDQVIKIFVG